MRILVVHNRYRSDMPSGENRVVDLESALLQDAGHEVVSYERASDDIAGFNLGQRALLPIRVAWSPAERRSLRAAIAEARPDVVHLHNTFPLMSPSVVAACKDAGVPTVMTLHNFRLACANGLLLRSGIPCRACVGRSPLPAIQHGCYRDSRLATAPVAVSIGLQRVLGTVRRHVDLFIAPSRFLAETIVGAGIPEDKMLVKPHFIPRPRVRRSGSGEDFVFIGRLAPEKGVDVLLDAWSAGGWRRSLIFAGDGPMRTVVERAARTDASIRYLGYLGPDDCAALRARARALVMPSRFYETFALSAVEALAASVPAIASSHGALLDIDGENAGCVHVRPGSPESLEHAMRRLDDDDDLSVILGSRGVTYYERHFTPEEGLGRLIKAYESVEGSKR